MNNKIAGSVKYYNEKKGYGFIAGEDEKDYFVHCSNLTAGKNSGLNKNDKVEFIPGKNQKGNNATEVTVTESAKSNDHEKDQD